MATQLSLVNQPYTLAFSRNPLYFRWKVTHWDVADNVANTRIQVKIFAESRHYQGDFRDVYTYMLSPDASGFAWVDVAAMLDAQLVFYLPRPKQKGIQLARRQAIRYRLQYVLVNDFEQITSIVTTSEFTVFKGGLAKAQADAKTFFAQKTALGSDRTFLRFDEELETIHVDDPIWLTAIARFSSPTITLRILASQPNGSATIIDITQPVDCVYGMLLVVPAGIGEIHHNIAPLATTVAVKYQLRDVNGVIWGQTPYITIDKRNNYSPIRLTYFNSLGGFDLIRLSGQVEFSTKYKKEQLRRIDVAQFAQSGIVDAEESSHVSGEKMTPKAETGFRALGEILRLRDLLNSSQIWEFTPGSLLPATVTGESYSLYTTIDDLYNLTIAWETANEERNYTPNNYLDFLIVCPDVVFFEVTQVNPRLARINWQLADGYDFIEVVYTLLNVLSPDNTMDRIILEGNSGSVDINLPSWWVFPPPDYRLRVNFWARTVCDRFSTPMSTGAFTPRFGLFIRLYPAPILRNDFAVTYKAAGSRILNFTNSNSIYTNDSPVNGGTVQIVNSPITGSAGGTIVVATGSGKCAYTPASATYEGTEIFIYEACEIVPNSGGIQSAIDSARIYVTVESVTGISTTGVGKPYFKLSTQNANTKIITSPVYTTITEVDVVVQFYNDPFGNQALNVSGLGLNLQIQEYIRFLDATTNQFSAWQPTNVLLTLNNLTGTSVTAFSQKVSSRIATNPPPNTPPVIEYRWELVPSTQFVVL